jgi:hypothetical protein
MKVVFTSLLVTILNLSWMPVPAQFSFSTGTAQTSTGSKQVRLLDDVTVTAQLSKYGGAMGKTEVATGYFSVRKVNNNWTIIDPEGYLFFTVGVNSVSKGGGIILPDALRNIGANSLGCWSDETINTGTSAKMAYCPRWNFMQTYKNGTQRTKDLFSKGIIPVFDAAYVSFCDTHARQLETTKNDPYLLGHFSDNELPLYDNTSYGDLLDRYLAISDKADPNYLAANNWMISRKGSGYSISDTDREEFHGYVAGNYYRITAEAIKRYDPNHLYLGSRLHGGALSKPSIYLEAAKYVDIISINCYNVWTPSKGSMDMWSSGGKPFLITEFYAKAEDSGLTNESGAGWLVKTQTDRAKFFENFVLALIGHPGCVGFHHFKYIDDPDSNKGLVNLSYQWYEPLKNSFFKIARNIYELRQFLLADPTGLNYPAIHKSIRMFPNPTRGKVIIKGEYFPDPCDFDVFSISGEKIRQIKTAFLPYELNLSQYPAGQYIVKVYNHQYIDSQQILLTN